MKVDKWIISKEFDFCYGHRVWSQVLNPAYSIDSKCACRHLHGHQGKIIVKLEATKLKDGMVTDFKHLNWFKQFLDTVLDHKFIVDRNDPMFKVIVPHTLKGEEIDIPWIRHTEGYYDIDPNFFKTLTNDPFIELLEGFVSVEFVPTSENLSAWLFDVVDAKMEKIGIKTHSVTFYETPKSQSTFAFGE